MFITKKHLSRRTILRGLGASIALPLLDAMIPAHTALAKTAAAPKVKLSFIYFPHGAIMDKWTPATDGTDFEISPILAPLSKYKKQLTVISNLGNRPAESAAVHAIVPATWLSCVHPRETQEPFAGVTIDQIAAQHIGQETPLPSLEVAAEAGGAAGACDRVYGCSYSGTISFRTPTTPLPMEYNPRNLFQRLFGRGESAEDRKLITEQYKSILDMVADDAASLRRSLGAGDQAALSDYLETVRELERRLQKMEQSDVSKLKLPEVPLGMSERFEEQQAMMFDMMALAFQGNLTRITSMMMAAEVSGMTYNFIGVPDAFHPVSHHQNDASKIEKLIKIQTYHSTKVAKFLDRLAAMPDGEGSMLDHSIIVYGSNMSNSNAHNQYPLPTSIIGGGCGKLKGNQHLRYPEHTPLANVMLTVLDRAGVPTEKIGDSSGLITEL